jgi:4-amino-4-deoxy-L-arabinose transferase-like glycosyltransferase
MALMALALLLAAAVIIGWTGFIASDDALYFTGAEHWLTHPPFAGDTHWSTRFPLIWSFAAMLLLFGHHFTVFAATALVWYAVLLALTGCFVRRLAGLRAAWLAVLLVGTMPVVIANATTVSIDLLEASALLAGAWLLGDAGSDGAGRWRGVLAGLCFGVAILGRETAILSLVSLVPLFLIGRPVRRDILIAAGIGVLAVLGAEALFQYAMTGLPFRRYDLAFHHDGHIDRAANLEGNFLLHPAIDPLLVLLVNDDFGLIFWTAMVAVFLAGRRFAARGIPRPLVILSAMAVADFVLVAVLVHQLVLNPRYFTVPAILAAIVTALWLDQGTARRRWLVAGMLVAINFGFLSLSNRHPRWEEEALVMACTAHPDEPVSADPVTARRAALPLWFAGLGRAHQGAASPDGLMLVPADTVPPGPVLARYPSPPTLAGALLRDIGLENTMPHALRRRLFAPNLDYVLIRMPRQPLLASPAGQD